MKHQLFHNGPSIVVSTYFNNKGIERIHLELNKEQGLSLQCEGSRSQKNETAFLLESYLRGEPFSFTPDFGMLTPFQIGVLSALKEIPWGSTESYSSLAKKIGNPKAARAIGSACGINPFPLLIPCHRVLAQNNRLGGFSLDINVKRRLLDFEKIVYS